MRIIIYLDDVANGKDVKRNSHSEKHIDFSITTFEFCGQPQRISPSSCKLLEFLGLIIYSHKMTLAPSEKKFKHVTMEMEILTQPKTLMLNCHQLFKAFHQHE